LLASESTSPVFKNNNGAKFVSKVYFKGQNKQGVRYGAIAAFKEYGVRKGRTQEAARFREKAVSSKGNSAIAAMQQVLDEEINKL
jgi:hypothetical protein